MRPRILFIEPDPFFASICLRHFRDALLEVAHAPHGEEGWRSLQASPPDLVVLELVTPRRDGFRILEEMRADEETRLIPVIVVTKLSSQEDIDRCRSLGVEHYFIKPHCSVEHVCEAIKGHFYK